MTVSLYHFVKSLRLKAWVTYDRYANMLSLTCHARWIKSSFERQLFWHQINFCFTFLQFISFSLFLFIILLIYSFLVLLWGLSFSCVTVTYRKIKKEMIVKHTKFSKKTHYKKTNNAKCLSDYIKYRFITS